jgi:hypothetical protein
MQFELKKRAIYAIYLSIFDMRELVVIRVLVT